MKKTKQENYTKREINNWTVALGYVRITFLLSSSKKDNHKDGQQGQNGKEKRKKKGQQVRADL